VLKPFDDERFRVALDRAREQLSGPRGTALQKLEGLVDELKRQMNTVNRRQQGPRHTTAPASSGFLEKFVVKASGRVYLVRATEVERIKAAGQYVEIRAKNQEHLLRQTMNEVEVRLDPQKFLRIHRSVIVNADFIEELRPWGKGLYQVVLMSGEQFLSSHGYRANIDQLMEKR